jgi:hypothetical protein
MGDRLPTTMVLAVALTGAAAALAAGCGGAEPTHESMDAGAPKHDASLNVFIDASVTLVKGGAYSCPGISSFSIDPASVIAGQAAQLGIETIGPTPSTIEWTASPDAGGAFSSATSLTPTFLCSQSGNVTVSVEVTLFVSGVGNVCEGAKYTSYSGNINCE